MITNMEYVMSRGMDCLIKELGPIDTAEFIVAIKADRFDYAEWRRNLFDNMVDKDYLKDAAGFEKSHPFTGKAERI